MWLHARWDLSVGRLGTGCSTVPFTKVFIGVGRLDNRALVVGRPHRHVVLLKILGRPMQPLLENENQSDSNPIDRAKSLPAKLVVVGGV